MLRYRGNIKDQWIDFKYWGLNWLAIMGLFISNPYKVMRGLFAYPWIFDLLKANNLAKRYNEGRNGTALHISLMTVHSLIKGVIRFVKNFIYESKNVVLSNVMIPLEIYQAMGLKWFMTEIQAALLPILDQHCCDKYMDAIENEGLPGDTCSYPRITAGMFAKGHIPKNVKMLISNNLPCEGGQASYGYYELGVDAPTFRLDVPYNFNDDENLEIFAGEIKNMIAFLEKHSGRKMDWDKLREICENFNRMNELELERWELLKSDTPVLVNENIWLPHYYYFNIESGSKYSLELYESIHKKIMKAHKEKEGPFKNMRFRTILWNPPTFAYGHFWNWLECCWGIACLNDMETFGHFDTMFIDTDTIDTMLKGLAKKWCSATMARHTRGPVENYLSDIWYMADIYRADFILMANHIGCRSSIALIGIIKEEAKKRGIPICIFDYELMDSRICSRQGIRDQINSFMQVTMKTEPLNGGLLVIDDDDNW